MFSPRLYAKYVKFSLSIHFWFVQWPFAASCLSSVLWMSIAIPEPMFYCIRHFNFVLPSVSLIGHCLLWVIVDTVLFHRRIRKMLFSITTTVDSSFGQSCFHRLVRFICWFELKDILWKVCLEMRNDMGVVTSWCSSVVVLMSLFGCRDSRCDWWIE